MGETERLGLQKNATMFRWFLWRPPLLWCHKVEARDTPWILAVPQWSFFIEYPHGYRYTVWYSHIIAYPYHLMFTVFFKTITARALDKILVSWKWGGLKWLISIIHVFLLVDADNISNSWHFLSVVGVCRPFWWRISWNSKFNSCSLQSRLSNHWAVSPPRQEEKQFQNTSKH